MKSTIEDLKASFSLGYEIYEDSIRKARRVYDMYHNKQYSEKQLSVLKSRGAPAETFNVIKLFTRALIGYYSTVVNTVKAEPTHPRDVNIAALLNDALKYVARDNQLETMGDDIKLDLLLSGLCCAEIDIEDSGDRDEFGRPINDVILNHIPASQCVLDHMSVKQDYSDARWLHVFKWVSAEVVQELLKGTKYTLDSFDAERNHLSIPEADFAGDRTFSGHFTGSYKKLDHYLLVDSVIVDDEGKRWRILWIDEIEIQREEITFNEVKFPYRVQKLYKTTDLEFYGIFEDVIESQDAINQALIKLQQLVSTQKVLVENGGVEDIERFKDQFNRINAICEVLSLDKIKVEQLTREAAEQYQVIDKAFERIKLVLGVNDSFLGMAFASDSGRKVKLQQNATAMSLRYITIRIEQFYRLMGWDVINLIKQFYYANRVLLITDQITGDRWIEINKPLKVFKGMGPNGPIMSPVFEEVLDPNTGKPMEDEDGNLIMAPVASEETDLMFTKINVSLDSISYNDEDEKTQLLMEQALSGPMGQSLMQISPQHYLKVISLVMKTTKMRFSPELSRIYDEAAGLVEQQQVQPQGQTPGIQGQGSLGFDNNPKSQALKLPQNTNEGV